MVILVHTLNLIVRVGVVKQCSSDLQTAFKRLLFSHFMHQTHSLGLTDFQFRKSEKIFLLSARICWVPRQLQLPELKIKYKVI